MFNPTEIIFASTQACNLKCPHCFVSKSPLKLDINDAKKFMDSCSSANLIESKNSPDSTSTSNSVSPQISSQICKIGFSGGEPFLYQEFLVEIIKYALEKDFMFDQIMTNGDWWKNETELKIALQKIYDAGFDGKIGLSYDSFHGQDFEKIKKFCAAVNEIFGEENLNIQTVIDPNLSEKESNDWESKLNVLSEEFFADIYILPQTFQSKDPKAWQSKKWFKEDFCEGPGQILFVHATGDIAPCCGFANENPALFIGKITDDFKTIMKNASVNKMVNLCYNEGLLKTAKKLSKISDKNRKNQIPGKTGDICTFCDFMCNL